MDNLTTFDDLYFDVLKNLEEFFRYERRTWPENDERYGEAFYKKAGTVFKDRIDFELKNLNNQYLV